ncbi:DUF342 domain-containing protein [Clostridium chauvoei]|nr:flagellar assembly protein A [Clostridium chauvoei]MBX7281015.1 FapA family protein [Clostridium chauvoei]MBX7283484.1 FapA family protein [Clostridium chauvoei]MBX7286104.1 FapA family protein [Clostridium chauvoei]MBX7291101.1 FapA family protein [Clostridium chauvoei]MBX7293595.1 FapA family protein [Clostridium chauvoei]
MKMKAEENYMFLYENVNGSVEIQNGKFIVIDPLGEGEFAKIIPTSNGELYINNKLITDSVKVKSTDKIEFKGKEEEGETLIEIKTNKDKTEAHLTVTYIPGNTYKLIDAEESNLISLETKKIQGKLPKKVSKLEILQELKNNKIIYGINKDILNSIEENDEIQDLIIAEGIKPIDPQDDKLEIYFNRKEEKDIDSLKNIDYKNLNYVTSIKAGEILAEIIKGEEGKDGIDVFGKTILKKPKNKFKYKIGEGCALKDRNIIAIKNGRPNIARNIITVQSIYVVDKDIDISTGNIDFAGAIEVRGKVTEGMEVKAAKGVHLCEGVFSAKVEAKGESTILGNIVNSKIKVGSTDLLKESRITSLTDLAESLNAIIANLKFLKEKNLVNKNATDGLLIKTLIDTKYKVVNRQCISVISSTINDEDGNSKVISLIKSKLIGLAPTKIVNYSELKPIVDEALKEIDKLKENLSIPVDLKIEYAQESTIEASGDIFITGKGIFASNINSLNNIEFLHGNAICRGGHIKAKNIIKSKVIGSEAGFATKLEVDSKGHIYADVAYQNTVFIVGNRRYVLDKPSKNIHAYLNKNGEIEIEKFLL